MSTQRASRQRPQPQYVGHRAGAHPDDQPYLSDELEEDDAYYATRQPTSAIRYTQPRQQVIQRGNKRLVIHNEPPPKRHMHWSLFLGLGMILALALWMGASEGLAWWSSHQLDSLYGMPRTYQTDAIVYPSDSSEHPSHYIFLNLNGTVAIVEIPHGDITHARMYKGPAMYADNPGNTPVTGEFRQVNGKTEMIVHVGDQSFVYINDGSQFKPQQ
jgi:hypothetical protein